MREEYHVTVTGDPIEWHRFCCNIGIKPLHGPATGSEYEACLRDTNRALDEGWV